MVQRGVNAIGGDAALRASSNTTYEFDAAVCGIGQEETSRPRLAYVQSRRVRGVADVIQPGPGMSPVGSHEVVAMVRARGVTVDRVVGAHSGSVRWSEEVAAAAR